ncbi:MAG: TolC family protein [Marinifilaceae bacterium]
MFRKVALLLQIVFISAQMYGQGPQQSLTLNQVLQRAQTNSLDAFLQKNMYLAHHWEYKSYRADLLPNLSLSMTPMDYNRTFTQRYNSVTDRDEYREQQSLYSYARMSLMQNLTFSGGTIFVDSDLGRLENFGDGGTESYSSTPVRFGLIQPLFGYNKFKWESKLEPLKFEKAKKEYLVNLQDLNVKAVNLFFVQAIAQLKAEMARTNRENAIVLLEMGKKRFKIAAIKQNELLNLELNVLTAEIDQAKAEKELQQAQFDLNLFLDLEEGGATQLILPSDIPDLTVNASQAMELAQKNHPLLLELKQLELEADRDVEKTRRDSRFQANLVASYGLNQQAEGFSNAYKDPLSQQKVQVSLDIPILDWGKRRGKYKMAQSDREVKRLSAKQRQIDFTQEVSRKVIDFNLQHKLVHSAKKADDIARKSYQVTLKLFKEGKSTVLQLDDALNKQEAARQDYIQNLQYYWTYYYTLQKLTLFDFIAGKALKQELDNLD